MLFWLIPLAIIIIAFVVVCVVIYRKVPQLRKIDVESLPKERERKLKHELIMGRLTRTKHDKLAGVSRVAGVAVKQASRIGRRAVQKLYAIEQYYKKIQQTQAEGEHALDKKTVKRLINEAEELVREEEYIPAEKIYIEIISHNPKHVEAYEGLGNLYLRAKQFKQARESLLFALRLEPTDASVLMSMGELEIMLENLGSAVDYLRKAVHKRPGNPKYLDAYIEASLDAKLFEDARKGLGRMKEVNAENKKIPDWNQRLAELDPTPPSALEEPSQSDQ